MSVWDRLGEIVVRVSNAAKLSHLVEAVRALFGRDPELRRKVAFSVAMIALSAKMAKADGVVTQDEVRAFGQIFAVPASEARNVSRLYDLAREDVAGFELYAERMARLCGVEEGGDDALLEDVLDGLFHIAKADGMFHEREGTFLRRIAEIFGVSEARYDTLLARHLDLGASDPWRVLGVERDLPFTEVRRHYRQLVAANHPDRLIARGLPEEFIAIATGRLAAINTAFETIERAAARA
ncbi:MAG: molecular chaperone DjlA [Mesorhizobium amorphae]|nr:MAG: molecular chaperone DjlA [Mesorhizobium amorphae]